MEQARESSWPCLLGIAGGIWMCATTLLVTPGAGAASNAQIGTWVAVFAAGCFMLGVGWLTLLGRARGAGFAAAVTFALPLTLGYGGINGSPVVVGAGLLLFAIAHVIARGGAIVVLPATVVAVCVVCWKPHALSWAMAALELAIAWGLAGIRDADAEVAA